MKRPMTIDHQLENPGGIFTVVILENDFSLSAYNQELGDFWSNKTYIGKCDFWEPFI